MVVMVLIERDVCMTTEAKQRLKFICLRYGHRCAGAADVSVEADDLVGFGHDHVKVV